MQETKITILFVERHYPNPFASNLDHRHRFFSRVGFQDWYIQQSIDVVLVAAQFSDYQKYSTFRVAGKAVSEHS